MAEIVYLNGNFVLKNEAFVSPEDRGFNFADGIYEVIKYYGGKPFRYADHMDRLRRSLREISIDFDNLDQFEVVFQTLLEQNGLANQEAGVYLQITRGSHTRIHQFPESIKPTVYATAFPFSSKWDQLKNGVKVITTEDIRWLRCDIKSISLLPNVLAAEKAYEQNAVEAIFIRNGMVTEGSHSSFMAVKNGVVYTHPDSNLILPGITKIVIREICKTNNIPLVEEPIPASELMAMEEMMIIGSGSEVTPIVRLDESLVGDGKPGQVTLLIQEKFFELTKR
ncbi:D-alanine aminotransferase [Aquipluma nitroreducens]|uniref:D-alanine aminotransferase n=1 Tax=Aquipluma nitroreducens TaxID=2010828 RepID=A0A5K7S607_9BACT|nr:D-amino-acid transaminase [Aquipluma nitroreducens]BBE16959.1 D-alanine aminotransferase [Aquipluma nitroreducens]